MKCRYANRFRYRFWLHYCSLNSIGNQKNLAAMWFVYGPAVTASGLFPDDVIKKRLQ